MYQVSIDLNCVRVEPLKTWMMQDWTQTLGRLFPPFILRVRKQESRELSPMASWWQSCTHASWFTPYPAVFIRGAHYSPHRLVFHVSSSPFVIRSQTALGLEDASEMFGPHFTLTGEASAAGLYWFPLCVCACARSVLSDSLRPHGL